MDAAPVVLTGRVAAAGWRLGGARVRIVQPKDAAAAFADACADARLLLVDADVAAALPAAALDAARRGLRPFVLVVSSPSTSPAVPIDVVAHARRVLGIQS